MDENMENNAQNQGNQANNGLAIAGFVVGLVSIFLNFYCITGIVGLILSILGFKKSKETEKGKGLAIAGISCSVIGIIVGIIGIIIAIAAVNILKDNAQNIVNTVDTLNSLYY